MFADVDAFLSAHGFVLWRLLNLVHYGRDGLRSGHQRGDFQAFDSRVVSFAAQGGQLFWANAHYVAADVFEGPHDRARRAAIAAHCFGDEDLAELLVAGSV